MAFSTHIPANARETIKNHKIVEEKVEVRAFFNGWSFALPEIKKESSFERDILPIVAKMYPDGFTKEALQMVSKVNTTLNLWKAQGKMPRSLEEHRVFTEKQLKQLGGDDCDGFVLKWFGAISHLVRKGIIQDDDMNGILVHRQVHYSNGVFFHFMDEASYELWSVDEKFKQDVENEVIGKCE